MKFDFDNFGIDCSGREYFVASAKKYSKKETLLLWETEGRFVDDDRYRKPTIADVFDDYIAYRLNASKEWEDGCYIFVGEKEVGATPVWVIEYAKLKEAR